MQWSNNTQNTRQRSSFVQFLYFVRSSMIEIVIDALVMGGIYFILHAIGTNAHVIAFILLFILMGGALRLLIRFMGDRVFWKDVDALIASGVNSFDYNKLLHEPMSYQGQVTFRAIDEIISEYARSVQGAQKQNAEQKEFIETWIHEIKTPLAASYLIADHYPGASALELKKQLSRIEAYTEQALFYARMQSLDRDFIVKKNSISHMVNEAIKSRSLFLIENDIRIKTENLDCEVLCDEKWMIFIIGQLIDNALKYRDHAKPYSELEFSLTRSADDVEDTSVLKIRDNGVGISSADIERIFDKGFTGSNGRLVAREKATGIGLYLVLNLSQKMGIDVDVESEEGEYTAVRLTFRNLSQDL